MADQENPAKTQVCVWCAEGYDRAHSRARQAGIFCSRRCETEARFWLYALLNPAHEKE